MPTWNFKIWSYRFQVSCKTANAELKPGFRSARHEHFYCSPSWEAKFKPFTKFLFYHLAWMGTDNKISCNWDCNSCWVTERIKFSQKTDVDHRGIDFRSLTLWPRNSTRFFVDLGGLLVPILGFWASAASQDWWCLPHWSWIHWTQKELSPNLTFAKSWLLLVTPQGVGACDFARSLFSALSEITKCWLCVCVCVCLCTWGSWSVYARPPPPDTHASSPRAGSVLCVCVLGGGGVLTAVLMLDHPGGPKVASMLSGGEIAVMPMPDTPPPHGPLRGQVESQGRTYVFCGGGQYCHVGPCGFQAEPLFFKIAQKISNVTRTRDRALFDIWPRVCSLQFKFWPGPVDHIWIQSTCQHNTYCKRYLCEVQVLQLSLLACFQAQFRITMKTPSDCVVQCQ